MKFKRWDKVILNDWQHNFYWNYLIIQDFKTIGPEMFVYKLETEDGYYVDWPYYWYFFEWSLEKYEKNFSDEDYDVEAFKNLISEINKEQEEYEKMKENLLNSIDKRINRLHHEILNLKKQAEKSETEFEKLSVLKYNLHSFREIRHYFNKYF